MTIHCLITKICELGACFLYFSYVLAQNGGVTSHPFHPPGSVFDLPMQRKKKTATLLGELFVCSNTKDLQAL